MRRHQRLLIVGLVLAISLAFALPGRAASAAAPVGGMNSTQSDLTWFMAGLRDLGRSTKAKLRLTPAQAKKILPELESLVKEKILMVEVAKQPAAGTPGNAPPAGLSGAPTGGGNAGTGGGMSDEERVKMEKEQKAREERIVKAIDRMESALKQAQADHILGMDFDAEEYGLGGMGMGQPSPPTGAQSGTQTAPSYSRSDLQKMQQARQAGMEKLVKLNKEVLEMVRKLAKSAR